MVLPSADALVSGLFFSSNFQVMKWRFQWLYYLGLLLLLAAVFWSVWANAQPSVSTNRVSAESSLADTNKFQALTFGLDNVDFLKQHTFLEQPLWKYLALADLSSCWRFAWRGCWTVIVNVLAETAGRSERKPRRRPAAESAARTGQGGGVRDFAEHRAGRV